ncbi:MAG: hypothetical protein VX051_05500, partial [Verrucomicrobiota bacterium]|nr:hypothetical protein [Verrucomicrobiota bacterium]
MKARLCLCVLIALPSLAEAHCDSLEITVTSWESNSSALAVTFNSKPGKIYEVLGSPDFAEFIPLTDVAGESEFVQTTLAAPSVGEDQYFFKIQEKLEAPNATWLGSHGGTREESHGHYIMECQDGGFLQVGETGIPGSNARILVVKTKADGTIEWKKQFGSGNRNMGNSSLEVTDGYLISGMLSSNSAILKLNKSTGSTIFSKTHNNGGIDGFEHMALTSSGILAVGFIRAEDAENTFFPYAQGYITFLDAEGNKTIGQSVNSYMSHAYRIKPIGSDYIISGTTEDALQYAVIKINSSGGLL